MNVEVELNFILLTFAWNKQQRKNMHGMPQYN